MKIKVISSLCFLGILFSGCSSSSENVKPKLADDDIRNLKVHKQSSIIASYLENKGIVVNEDTIIQDNSNHIVLKTPIKAYEHIKNGNSFDDVLLDMDLYSLLYLIELIIEDNEIDVEEYKYKLYISINPQIDKFKNIDKQIFLQDLRNMDLDTIKLMKKEISNLMLKGKYE